MKTSRAPAMAGDEYEVPFGNSQTSGGGSVRLSFVSVDTPLCDGPRNDTQSCGTAPAGSGLGFRSTRDCARAPPAISGCARRALSRVRLEITKPLLLGRRAFGSLGGS